MKLTQTREESPESQVYNLLSFDYAIRKRITASGEIISPPHIEPFLVETNDFPSMQLIRWAWDSHYICHGSIFLQEKNKPSEEIQFGDARCTSLELHYKAKNSEGVKLAIEFTTRTTSISGEDIINQ